MCPQLFVCPHLLQVQEPGLDVAKASPHVAPPAPGTPQTGSALPETPMSPKQDRVAVKHPPGGLMT